MSRLPIAVIGGGHLGRIHARLAKQASDVELVAVADPFPAAREQVARELNVPTVADYRELFGRIEAAIVATPTTLHHPVALDLLEHDLHVFVEKPITPSLPEADELVAAARSRQRVLQVGHVERFNPALQAVWPSLKNPKYMEAVRASGYSFRSTDIGVVLDLMIHDLDVVLALARSEVVDVQAMGFSIFGKHEDLAQARLTFASGCVAQLSASRVSYQPQRRLQVFTDRCYALVDFGQGEARLLRPDPQLVARTLDVDALPAEEKARLKETLFSTLLPLETLPVEKRNAIADEQTDFASAIRENRRPRVTGQQARDALAVAQRILQCIAVHAWEGSAEGPTGPLAIPTAAPSIRAPHFSAPAASLPKHRRAG